MKLFIIIKLEPLIDDWMDHNERITQFHRKNSREDTDLVSWGLQIFFRLA
jgi:hypothetical protein